MSIINPVLNQRFHLNRYSDILYKGEVAESIVQIDPEEEARIEIIFDSIQTGTVFLNGTTEDLCTSGETVTFTAIKGKTSTNYFTLLEGVCPSGGMSGIMILRAINGDGSPILKSLFETSFFGLKTDMDKSYKLESYGYEKEGNAILLCESDLDIRLGDRVSIENDPDSLQYEVIENLVVQVDSRDDYRRIVLR